MFSRIIVLLVLLNLLTIGFFIWKTYFQHEPLLFPKNEEYKDVTAILQRELQLSPQQVTQFNTIRERFFEKEVVLKQIIKAEKDSMNVAMFNKVTDDALIQFLAIKISQNEYQMELLRYEQAKELKSVCSPKQQEQFEHLVIEIRDYFRPDNQPKKR
ncbi:hypothetical protein OX284_002410 [Flavobacterium sp. SUN046]|uniref:Spy/CpxP family protein refolding chaperone n=1 Tax=Flavobacterium sp. SUN046 TaxID=3002440 RepID=UPI002DB58C9D|nr:hypothetical protein [Flavobacterium sp. SUN046]MEC4048269.1 hypothetical protein [Flavobacterium sp. SUN046]